MTKFRCCFMALAAFTFAVLSGAVAEAKTVVCISGDNDRFANSAEGYYRQLRPSPPAHISVGTDSLSLRSCLSQVAAGDTLVIVAHGCAGYFRYGNLRIPGFRGGRAANGTGVVTVGPNRVWPFELPPNFTQAGLDITVIITSCFSATAPQGGKSTVQSMQDAIKPGNTVQGFTNEARVRTPWYRLTGGTQAQLNAAQQCLYNAAPGTQGQPVQDRIRLWLASYRPAGSGVTPNSQSVAEAALSNCVAAGPVQVRVVYDQPPVNGNQPGWLEPLAVTPQGDDYTDVPEDIDVSACDCEEPVPVVPTTWGAIKALRWR